MTQRKVVVERGSYRDSITLMKISNEVSALAGVKQAAATMATPLNKRLLKDIGFVGRDIDAAGADDLIIAVEGEDPRALEAGMKKITELLEARETSSGAAGAAALPTTLEEAAALMPDANLALISVPGEFAGREASKALDRRLNVFLFSSNVEEEKEVELKKRAAGLGLLMMGPDCGTAIINGVVLGFGNVVRRGSIGLVSASGTGLQQVSTLIHEAGLGISQAVGTGGRDLSDEVGGATTIQAMRLLAGDQGTGALVLVSKPPAAKTMAKVLAEAGRLGKPVVVCFLGKRPESVPDNCVVAPTLEDAALEACSLGPRRRGRPSPSGAVPDARALALKEAAALAPSQKYVRGLFSGGTLCYEAQVVMQGLLGEISSNVPLDGRAQLKGAEKSLRHTCVDLGAEEFVVGRAHPMMDYTVRKLRILEEARDPGTAVILLDVVLGYGSNPDPAAQLIPAIREANSVAERGKRHLSFVASIVGTEGDPQGIGDQAERLKDAGVLLMPSNAKASLFAALIATRGKGAGQGPEEKPPAVSAARRAGEGRRPSAKASKDALLGKELKVINLGVGTFADDLTTQGVKIVRVDWKPPAGGDAEVLDLLDKLR
jgi:FdrA protein